MFDYYTLRMLSLIDDWNHWRYTRSIDRHEKLALRFYRFNRYYSDKMQAFLAGCEEVTD